MTMPNLHKANRRFFCWLIILTIFYYLEYESRIHFQNEWEHRIQDMNIKITQFNEGMNEKLNNQSTLIKENQESLYSKIIPSCFKGEKTKLKHKLY